MTKKRLLTKLVNDNLTLCQDKIINIKILLVLLWTLPSIREPSRGNYMFCFGILPEQIILPASISISRRFKSFETCTLICCWLICSGQIVSYWGVNIHWDGKYPDPKYCVSLKANLFQKNTKNFHCLQGGMFSSMMFFQSDYRR